MFFFTYIRWCASMRPKTFEWLTSFNIGLFKTRSSSGRTDIELANSF